MEKNKIKKMAVFAGAVVLSGTISYSAISSLFNVKPFTHNSYSIYKINLKEYREDKVIDNPYYSKNGDFNKYILTNSVFVKTPFYADENGNLKRDVYSYDISNLTKEDINFIIENYRNQELILNKDYLKVINDALISDYSLLNDVSLLSYINSENAIEIPTSNETEIYYAEYDPNSNETIYYDSKHLDNMLNVGYITSNVVLVAFVYKLYNIIINNDKKKRIRRK